MPRPLSRLCLLFALLLAAACGAPAAPAPVENTAAPATPPASAVIPSATPGLPTEAPLPSATAPAAGSDLTFPVLKYVIQAGDTCAGIAQKFRITTDQLVAANAPNDCQTFAVGRVLHIPRSVPYDIQIYFVQAGDTFSGIAAHYRLQTDSLLWSNPGLTPETLREGMALYIPPVDGAVYAVRDGDTLAQVAAHFQVSAAAIASYPANDLPSASAAPLPGSLLVIPGGRPDAQTPIVNLSTPAVNDVVSFRYAPGGGLLVVTARSLQLLDPASRQVQWTIQVAEGCCAALAMSGSLLAGIAGGGGLVYAWDTSTGQQLYRLEDPAQHFSTLALSRDGQTLATGEFSQIRLWDGHTGQPRAAWATDDPGFAAYPWTAGITNLAFAADDQSFFSANVWTGQVMDWDTASGALRSSFALTNVVNYDFTPDAAQLLTDFNQYGFELRNPRTGAIEATHAQVVGAAGFETFSADGQRIAVWGYNTAGGSTAAVWQLATDTRLREFSVGGLEHPGWRRAALNADGSVLALSDERAAEIVFFDVATGKETGRWSPS